MATRSKGAFSPKHTAVLRDASGAGVVPGGMHNERTVFALKRQGLIDHSPNNAMVYTITDKGRQALQAHAEAVRVPQQLAYHKAQAESWRASAARATTPEQSAQSQQMVEHHESKIKGVSVDLTKPYTPDPSKESVSLDQLLNHYRQQTARVEQETKQIQSAQAVKEQYWKERDARQTEYFAKNPNATHDGFAKTEKPFADAAKKQMGEAGKKIERAVGRSERKEGVSHLPSREAEVAGMNREQLMGHVRAHRMALQDIDARSRGRSPEEVMSEKIGHHKAIEAAESKLSKMPQDKTIETGARGGRYYTSPTGQHIYVKDNPGAEVVGHVTKHRFHQGLPMCAHMAEPKRGR